MIKSMDRMKIEAAFETIAKKFKTSEKNVLLAYINNVENVRSMVFKMTGLK